MQNAIQMPLSTAEACLRCMGAPTSVCHRRVYRPVLEGCTRHTVRKCGQLGLGYNGLEVGQKNTCVIIPKCLASPLETIWGAESVLHGFAIEVV